MTTSTHTTTNTTLAGRVAVVTGASTGIGAATATRLAASGAKVAVLARRADRLEKLVNEIEQAGGTALAIAVDVTDAEAVRAAAERVASELGTVDLLFNNAGVMLPAPVEELPLRPVAATDRPEYQRVDACHRRVRSAAHFVGR